MSPPFDTAPRYWWPVGVPEHPGGTLPIVKELWQFDGYAAELLGVPSLSSDVGESLPVLLQKNGVQERATAKRRGPRRGGAPLPWFFWQSLYIGRRE